MSRAQGSLQREPVNHSWRVTRHQAQAVRQLATPVTRDNLSAETEREREKIKVFSCVGRKKSGQ